MDAKQIGDRLKRWRKQVGTSQQEVADLIGVKQPTFSRMEKGEIPISSPVLSIIARFLRAPIDYLIGKMSFEDALRADWWKEVSPDASLEHDMQLARLVNAFEKLDSADWDKAVRVVEALAPVTHDFPFLEDEGIRMLRAAQTVLRKSPPDVTNDFTDRLLEMPVENMTTNQSRQLMELYAQVKNREAAGTSTA